MKVAVVDHGMGNLRSVARALTAAGADVTVTSDPGEIAAHDGMCVPGQGIFGRCMEAVTRSGIDDVIRVAVEDDKPFLGICLGMQILFDSSEEGAAQGLGVIPGAVTRLPPTVTVPHMGWNTVAGDYYYFDHSYAPHPVDDDLVEGWCEHGARFAASVRRGSMLLCQFHPEKSGRAGIELLRGWLRS
jgi:imidazole glycerol-phosphate synthase subunit HisH